MVIPYAGSIEWYRHWLTARLKDLDDHEACAEAGRLVPIDAKALRRTMIGGADKPILLSVPLAKGADLVSDHGRWWHAHLGAINAVYGRTPYFPFLFYQIKSVYDDMEQHIAEGVSIESINRRLHDIAIEWIDIDSARMAFALAKTDVRRKTVFNDVASEISTNLNYNLSIFDLIFRYGRNSLFPLIFGKPGQ